MEYASRAVGNAALTTGIIGTSLGALTGAGGLAGILGLGNGTRGAASGDPGDKPVTRYEMSLFQEIGAKNDEIVLLKANQYSDANSNLLQREISEQVAWNAATNVTLGNISQQIKDLYGLTKFAIPMSSIYQPIKEVYSASSTSTTTTSTTSGD